MEVTFTYFSYTIQPNSIPKSKLEQFITRPLISLRTSSHAFCEHLPLLSWGYNKSSQEITYCTYLVCKRSCLWKLLARLVEPVFPLYPLRPFSLVIPVGGLSGLSRGVA